MGNQIIKVLSVFSRFLFILIFSIAIILLGAYLAFLTYQTIFNVPVVQVPSVVNMELEAAQQRLYQAGLKMAVLDDHIFREGEQFIVISQRPEAGTEVKKNRTVEVEIKELKIVQQIPNLIGKTIAEAEMILSESGYQIGDIAYTMHYQIPEGRIIAQTPQPGENRASDGKINILVSKGLY